MVGKPVPGGGAVHEVDILNVFIFFILTFTHVYITKHVKTK